MIFLNYNSFRLLTVQKLELRLFDRERRYDMSLWLQGLSEQELNKIAFTDEATFSLGKFSPSFK